MPIVPVTQDGTAVDREGMDATIRHHQHAGNPDIAITDGPPAHPAECDSSKRDGSRCGNRTVMDSPFCASHWRTHRDAR